MKFLLSVFLLVILLGADQTPTYTKADITGNFDPAKHKEFVRIDQRYATQSSAYLRIEVYEAFKKMAEAAEEDGISLVILSATRNHTHQKGIWERKWNRYGGEIETRAERILQYSSMPGTSRHHWGTDFDINALNNSYFETGKGAKVYQWMQENAASFGFFQPYTGYNQYRDAGYREEKWHWSYYPLAQRLQRAYNHVVDYDDITGFKGSEFAEELKVINNYVNAIEVPKEMRSASR